MKLPKVFDLRVPVVIFGNSHSAMKTLSLLFAVAALTFSSSQAAIVFQTQNYSNVNGSTAGSGLSLNWDKFDTGLGTLTGITMEITGSISGSFDLINNDPTPVDIYNSSSTFRMNFSAGTGAPSNIFGTAVSPISTTPGTGALPGTTVAASSSQTFTINGPISLYSSGPTDFFANASYFSAAGPASFSTILFRNFTATVDGSLFTLDTTSAVMGGTINLTYEYTPTSAIPEPGTWAAAALLAGGAAYARWRKRKSA